MVGAKNRHLWIGAILVVLALCASHWQWRRHKEKVRETVQVLKLLESPVIGLNSWLAEGRALEPLEFRRVNVKGRFDFEREFTLRNRRFQGQAGVFVITPLILDNHQAAVLVNRGFIPLARSSKEQRREQRGASEAEFVGILRLPMRGRSLGPQDRALVPGEEWRDSWLRIDPELVQPQIPTQLLPCYVEFVQSGDPSEIFEQLVEKKSGRDEVLSLATKLDALHPPPLNSGVPSPAHVLLPPDIHRGYVVEWIFIAFFIAACTFVAHIRKLRRR